MCVHAYVCRYVSVCLHPGRYAYCTGYGKKRTRSDNSASDDDHEDPGANKHHVVAQTASKQLTLQLVLAYGVLPLAEAAVAVQLMGMVFTGTIYRLE